LIGFVIIDDEKWVRSVVKNAIDWRALGYELLGEAADGEAALKLVGRTRPNLVLTDIRMPGVDGFKFIEAIGGRTADAKIVIISGYDDFQYAQKAMGHGVYAFITKPIDEDELRAVATEVRGGIEGEQRRAQQIADMKTNLARLSEIVRWNATREDIDAPPETPRVEDDRITKALEIVALEYASPLGTREVSERVFMSEAYFSDRFGKLVGKSFSIYLAEYRVSVAITLLEQPELRVKDVAPLVGFESTNYFCRVFKRYAGCTPGEYRATLRSQREA
jgi:two-component system response regulator YesN